MTSVDRLTEIEVAPYNFETEMSVNFEIWESKLCLYLPGYI